ncbi:MULTISPECIES: hypothetical protein [unclassified Thioalkalivibrio]|uniref:hypothetical protein n=1 Tax=unclassified Thioalkalivibrio TaxID=2621013 RepID=UPI0003695946|nr:MULTISPECIES: hypothetical protein [unclassified Thioalkalivibrio]
MALSFANGRVVEADFGVGRAAPPPLGHETGKQFDRQRADTTGSHRENRPGRHAQALSLRLMETRIRNIDFAGAPRAAGVR